MYTESRSFYCPIELKLWDTVDNHRASNVPPPEKSNSDNNSAKYDVKVLFPVAHSLKLTLKKIIFDK